MSFYPLLGAVSGSVSGRPASGVGTSPGTRGTLSAGRVCMSHWLCTVAGPDLQCISSWSTYMHSCKQPENSLSQGPES